MRSNGKAPFRYLVTMFFLLSTVTCAAATRLVSAHAQGWKGGRASQVETGRGAQNGEAPNVALETRNPHRGEEATGKEMTCRLVE